MRLNHSSKISTPPLPQKMLSISWLHHVRNVLLVTNLVRGLGGGGGGGIAAKSTSSVFGSAFRNSNSIIATCHNICHTCVFHISISDRQSKFSKLNHHQTDKATKHRKHSIAKLPDSSLHTRAQSTSILQ